MRLPLLAALVATTLTTAWADTAHAESHIGFANHCHALNGYTAWEMQEDGYVENTSSSLTAGFSCAIDNSTTTSTSRTIYSDIRVKDQNSGANVSCQLFAVAVTGTSWTWSTAQTSTGSSSSLQTLSPTFSVAGNSHLGIYCQVPPSSAGATSRIYDFNVAW
ncbi:MAG: hypothetical protein KC619_00405 [Myxococcales bacterium]|nr:hypothetical protein [Myxococcales bacterium]